MNMRDIATPWLKANRPIKQPESEPPVRVQRMVLRRERARLKIAMEALEQIGQLPRGGRAKRIARSTMAFIEHTTTPIATEDGWLRKVLDDAKAAKKKWPKWAKGSPQNDQAETPPTRDVRKPETL